MVNAHKSLPDFQDVHLGVTEDMTTWKDPFWWGEKVLLTRLQNITNLLENKLNALFIHLLNKKSDFQDFSYLSYLILYSVSNYT